MLHQTRDLRSSTELCKSLEPPSIYVYFARKKKRADVKTCKRALYGMLTYYVRQKESLYNSNESHFALMSHMSAISALIPKKKITYMYMCNTGFPQH